VKGLKKHINGIKKMLSFNSIGNLGRLANQMFQYASLKGIATNCGYDFCIPPKDVFGNRDNNVRNSDVTIYDCFNLSNVKKNIISNPIVQESGFDFDKNIFNNCPDNIDLFGYFQSGKYFKHIENDIRKDFTFNENLLEICDSFIKENFENSDVISLHIRRGDYVSNPNHPVQTLEYYKEALDRMPDLPVIVFSDDHEWCKQQDLFLPDRFSVSEGNSTDADLCLMSLCRYHIIANSSFSWWGAWLAKSNKVVAPRNWFGGDCSKKNTKDLYLSDWEIL
jgi:hypothetical protein